MNHHSLDVRECFLLVSHCNGGNRILSHASCVKCRFAQSRHLFFLACLKLLSFNTCSKSLNQTGLRKLYTKTYHAELIKLQRYKKNLFFTNTHIQAESMHNNENETKNFTTPQSSPRMLYNNGGSQWWLKSLENLCNETLDN